MDAWDTARRSRAVRHIKLPDTCTRSRQHFSRLDRCHDPASDLRSEPAGTNSTPRPPGIGNGRLLRRTDGAAGVAGDEPTPRVVADHEVAGLVGQPDPGVVALQVAPFAA